MSIPEPVLKQDASRALWSMTRRICAAASRTTAWADSARKLNENCVRYQPALGLSADQMSDELVSLTVLLRHNAIHYAPQAGYTPLPKKLLREYVRPIGANGKPTRALLRGISRSVGLAS